MRSAFVFGIDHYPDPKAVLNGPLNDASSILAIATARGYQQVSPRISDGSATRNNILYALTQLGSNAKAGDELLFYYAGHGDRYTDTNNEQHDALAPVDYDWTTKANGILDVDLATIFQRFPSGVTLTWICDSCYSGGYLLGALDVEALRRRTIVTRGRPVDLPLAAPPATPGKVVTMMQVLAPLQNVVMLCAASATQESNETSDFDGAWHGVMTYFLTNDLNGAGGYAKSIGDLCGDLVTAVPSKYNQTATIAGNAALSATAPFA